MKKVFWFLLIFSMFLAGCNLGRPAKTNTPQPMTATPTTTATPTQMMQSSGDPAWDRVSVENLIIFGTSADYPPFESYDASFEINGFDPALARLLGEKLGLDVQILDIAFEGLPAALESGQIDAAIAAISVTPERLAMMDFTNIYYSGQDAILARQGSGIAPIITAAQLAQYRVAAQRGSIYQSWIQKTLIDTGLMPVTNLLVYEKIADAVRDLRENRNDLVVMDQLVAQEYVLSGGVAIIGEGLNRQLFAIALPKGSSVLRSKLNEALTALQNEGTLASISESYLNVPLPANTPTPQPTATPIPGPTATPSTCYDSMAFVTDVKVPDGTEIVANKDFDKVWRVQNTGTCVWDTKYQIVFVQGDRMEGDSEFVRTPVQPGEMYDLIIDQVSPKSPGKYFGVWQMVNAIGVPFGSRIWVKITVPGSPAPTQALPTSTPIPPTSPTSVPSPVISLFQISDPTVSQGNPVSLSWAFTGENLIKAELSRINPDGSITLLNGGADVATQGQLEDTLTNPGTYSYTLAVSSEFGGTTVKTVIVNVSPALPANDLHNVGWVLINFINPIKPDVTVKPLGENDITIEFAYDNSVFGFAGCNSFNTTYQLFNSNQLDISDQILTGQALCSDTVNGQEALVLDLLKSVEEYQIVGDELILKMKAPDTADGQMINVLTFEKSQADKKK